MKLRAVIAATSLVGAGGLAVAMPAHADLVTRCVGEGGAVTVPGDLVVPSGRACWLDGTTIEGNVRVQPGADLIVEGVTIKGTVTVQENAYFDATDSTIEKNVVARDAYGAMVYQSTLSGALNAQTAEESEYDAFVYVVDSSVSGKVDTKVTGEVVLDGADVSGQVAGNGVDYLDVYNSVIGGKLTVSGAAHGSVVCESEIYGAASFTGNSDTLQLGADGPVVECAGISTYWGDNLDISNNTATIVVSNNIVRGNLSGDGNDPAPTGENNRVRGEITGQFVDLAPAAALRRAAAPEERSGAGEKAAERREAAKAEADAAGKAQL